jgi:NTP pyrophosphatase (non-canonical NTP hydrolase)
MKPPNILTVSEQERLQILIEECGEVIQAASKVLRHGYESTNPTIEGSLTNREFLEKELGHLSNIRDMMVGHTDLNKYNITQSEIKKRQSISQWLHYQ